MSDDILEDAVTGRARAWGETAANPVPESPHRGVASIRCELYGVPRVRAGKALVEIAGNTVGEALADLLRQCPALSGIIVDAGGGVGRVHPAYRLSLSSDRFISDPATPLNDGDTLLLLTADVGG